jgi:hypothetical protein
VLKFFFFLSVYVSYQFSHLLGRSVELDILLRVTFVSHHPRSTSTVMSCVTTHSVFTGKSRYQRLHKLGEGTYGIVYKVREHTALSVHNAV